MPIHLQNLVKQAATSPVGAAGSYTLGAGASGFNALSLSDGESSIFEFDDGGSNREVFIGTYTAAGTTVSRDKCLGSTNSGAFISWGSATSGTLRVVGSAETNASAHPGYISGRVYGSMLELGGASNYGSVSMQSSRLYLHWFGLFEAVEPAGIEAIVAVVGSAGAIGRLGIFDDFKGRPGNLLVDAGTVACDASATPKVATISGILCRPPGVWLAIAFNLSTTMPAMRSFGSGYARQVFNGLPVASEQYQVSAPVIVANDGTDYSGGLPSDLKTATYSENTSQNPVLRLQF